MAREPELIFARPEGAEGPFLASVTVSRDAAGIPDHRDLDRRCVALRTGVRGGAIRITADPGAAEALRAAARRIGELPGSVHIFPDPGMSIADLLVLREETDRVLGLPREHGGSGDPSPFTALGVFAAIGACLGPLAGREIHVQGAGRVGSRLVALLDRAGAKVEVHDRAGERALRAVRGTAARAVDGNGPDLRGELFSPNARGAPLLADSSSEERCRYVAGAANGQLAGPGVAETLAERGIVWIPEWIAGSGWLMSLLAELAPGGWDEGLARDTAMRIAPIVKAHLLGRDRADS